MNKPKWQKARIVHCDRSTEQEILGREVWIETGKPQLPDRETHSPFDGSPVRPDFTYRCNVIDDDDGSLLFLDAEYTELLPEFADDVPLITWKDFLARRGAQVVG